MLGQFAKTAARARERYADFINAGSKEGHQEFFYGGKADARVVGEEDFVRGVLQLKASSVRAPRLHDIVGHVCHSYELRETELLAPGRARAAAEARAVVAWLALKTKAASLSALAQYFGRDISTLSHAVSRVDRRSRNSRALANALKRQLYAITQA